MTVFSRISSRQHAVVRKFRRAAARVDDTPLVLLDGEHLVREALDAGHTLTDVLSDGQHLDLMERAVARGAEGHTCTRAVMAAASPVRTPSGIVALGTWPGDTLGNAFATSPALVLGLVDVQDPGNVGSAIRSADALGATGVVALGASADPGGWKVLRGSMGSVFRLPVARGTLEAALNQARASQTRVVATTASGGQRLPDVDLTGPTLVLLGHEGGGLPPGAVSGADQSISIPMRAGIDSLNVAVAAALILDEARRQRARR